MSAIISVREIDHAHPLAKGLIHSSADNDSLRSFSRNTTARVKRPAQKLRIPKKRQTGGVIEQLFCGAFAGVVSRTVVAPLDLIRTHLLTSHGKPDAQNSAFDILTTILRRDGWRGLFRSNGINCLRVGPNKAIELCVFETLRRSLCKENNPLKSMAPTIAGGAAGIAGTLATYPLELMRTRISVQPHLYKGVKQAFQKIVQEEGIGALYRGLFPSLLGIFPYAAVNYYVYDSLRGLYRKTTGRENVPTIPTLCFGAFSGAVSSTFTFPIEVARRQLQLGALSSYAVNKSAISIVTNIYKQEGLLALYRGIGMTWFKLVPAAGISFMCYEAARVALKIDDASVSRAKRQDEQMRKSLSDDLSKTYLPNKFSTKNDDSVKI